MLDPNLLFDYSVVVFVASMFQALTGFGFNLLSTPVLFLLYEPRDVVVMLVVPSFLACCNAAWHVRQDISLAPLRGYLIFALPAVVGGVLALGAFPVAALEGLLALLLVYALLNKVLPGWMSLLSWTPLSGAIAGFSCGSLGTSGPAVVSWAHLRRWSLRQTQASTLILFVILGLLRILYMLWDGMLLDSDYFWSAGALVPAIAAGTLLGSRLSRRLPLATSQAIVQIGIAGFAAMMIYRALG